MQFYAVYFAAGFRQYGHWAQHRAGFHPWFKQPWSDNLRPHPQRREAPYVIFARPTVAATSSVSYSSLCLVWIVGWAHCAASFFSRPACGLLAHWCQIRRARTSPLHPMACSPCMLRWFMHFSTGSTTVRLDCNAAASGESPGGFPRGRWDLNSFHASVIFVRHIWAVRLC